MTTPKIRGTPIEDAVRAHTDLNMFAAAEELVSSDSFMSADSYDDAQQIARLCQRAQQKCLARFDKAVAKIKR
jgi:hypothetical protein